RGDRDGLWLVVVGGREQQIDRARAAVDQDVRGGVVRSDRHLHRRRRLELETNGERAGRALGGRERAWRKRGGEVRLCGVLDLAHEQEGVRRLEIGRTGDRDVEDLVDEVRILEAADVNRLRSGEVAGRERQLAGRVERAARARRAEGHRVGRRWRQRDGGV